MVRRVFIKVVGFTDVERHALNTVFRLSQQGDTAYVLWAPEAPEQARVALLDAQSYEAAFEAASPLNEDLAIVWVGDKPPPNVWRNFKRPLSWPEVITALNELFAPELSIDLDLSLLDSERESETGPSPRALIVSPDTSERLYWRSKLALAGMPVADEAPTSAEAMRLAGEHRHRVAFVDLSLLGAPRLIKQLIQAGVPHLIATDDSGSLSERIRGRLAGAEHVLGRASDPVRLRVLFERYRLEPMTVE